MYTSSSTATNMIVYDLNDVFAVVSLLADPTSNANMLAVVSYPSTSTLALRSKFSTAVSMYLDITPKNGYNIPGGAYFKVMIDPTCTVTNYFKFTGTCTSASNTCAADATSCTNITEV